MSSRRKQNMILAHNEVNENSWLADTQKMVSAYKNRYELKFGKGELLIISINGTDFTKFTENLVKPFDDIITGALQETVLRLCIQLPGTVFAYQHSDKIDLLIKADISDLKLTELISGVSSIVTLFFNNALADYVSKLAEMIANGTLDETSEDLNVYVSKLYTATFTVSAFDIASRDVINYFNLKQSMCIVHANNKYHDSIGKEEEETNIPSELLFGSAAYALPASKLDPEGVEGRYVYYVDRKLPLFKTNNNFITDTLIPIKERDFSSVPIKYSTTSEKVEE